MSELYVYSIINSVSIIVIAAAVVILAITISTIGGRR